MTSTTEATVYAQNQFAPLTSILRENHAVCTTSGACTSTRLQAILVWQAARPHPLIEGPSIKAETKNISDLPVESLPDAPSTDDVVEFLTSSVKRMQEDISIEHWLGKLANLTGADFAMCARWHHGDPNNSMIARFGAADPFSSGWLNWAEHIMEKARNKKPELILHGAEYGAGQPPVPVNGAINPTDVFLLPLDWHPTRVLIVLHKIDGQESWRKQTIKTLRLIAPFLWESIKLRTMLNREQLLSSTTTNILDTSPRGVMAAAPDGRVRYANSYAELILNSHDGLKLENLYLTIHDRGLHKELYRRLKEIKQCSLAELSEQDWDLPVPRPSGRAAYQVMLRAIPIKNWRIESGPSDRIASIFLLDPEKYVIPSYQQLQNFYNLTLAEARVAAVLYSGVSIVNAAEQLNLSVNTIRTHLRKIFPKLGVKNQAELLGKLTKTLKYGRDN